MELLTHDRLAELETLRRTDPVELVRLYRRATGMGRFEHLPPGLSLGTMIDTILEHETDHGRSSGGLPELRLTRG